MNRSMTGQIPSLASLFSGYCLILTALCPSFSFTIIGGAFFAHPGVSVAQTAGYTWSTILAPISPVAGVLTKDRLII